MRKVDWVLLLAFLMLATFSVSVFYYTSMIEDKKKALILEVQKEQFLSYCSKVLREVRGEGQYMVPRRKICIKIANGKEVM